MGGMAGRVKLHWEGHFESPYLARLAMWKAIREYKAQQEQQAERDRAMAAEIEQRMRHRDRLLEGPRLVRGDEKHWINT